MMPHLTAGLVAAELPNICMKVVTSKGSCYQDVERLLTQQNRGLTCSEFRWEGASTAGVVVCECLFGPSKGSAAQVHSCCSLQVNELIQIKSSHYDWRSGEGCAVRRKLRRTLTP